ncbi:maltose phosphorylase [Granulicatella balaenopterae]|uniref:Maltose phosphorylase n=1 Tax=Granulicatella balaenopterae TaxID=137733 RepID=A0A1H9HQS2_9LACT|nr:glycoside hydrolase family 65 protein [Granulicatella balaenopterae]SEQ64699.1 maltose phosphorylase [Granulicatella balaenopterae]
MIKRLFEIDPWTVSTHHLDKDNRRLQESLTSIGNGYMGMRGNFEEGYSGDHHQGTYIAGVWFPDKTRVGWWKNGYPEYFGKVINATNFIATGIMINGEKLDLAIDSVENFELSLNMQEGVLYRSFDVTKKDTKIHFEFERFLSIKTKELAFMKVTFTILEGRADIQLVPALDGNVQNEDSNYDEQFWLEEARGNELDLAYLTTKTMPNNFDIPQFSVTTAMKNKLSVMTLPTLESEELKVRHKYDMTLLENKTISLEKAVAVVTSRDVAVEHHVEKATAILEEVTTNGYDAEKAAHIALWQKRWHQADVMILGDEEAQQGIRFNIFQLFSTYYGEDSRLNVGPKGFTGEKYGGATYWDTEAYIVPMYLSVTPQEVTRQLLVYRHNQLEEAYHNARQQGLAGALYPMVTFTGVECHNEWEITFEEIHRNGAMAHAIYNYTNYTGDTSYIEREGLEVLVGIARFWADRVHYSKRKAKYMIHGVTGPNEYENNVNNNFHTNKIAAWSISYALESLENGEKTILNKLAVTKEEQEKWQDIIDNMYYPYDEELGIYVQHDTFLDKDLTPVSQLAPEDRPLNQNWSWDKILRSPYIKQADVLQNMYFFPEMYSLEEKERNFDFYEPLTVHESSLSPCIHAILAAELGKEEKAVELYARTARLDLDNYNNDTEDGLHITSMSGSWLGIVQGFAGMRVIDGQLSFKPFVPSNWTGYTFKINFRDSLIEVIVDKHECIIKLIEGESLPIKINQEQTVLTEKVIVKL